MEVVIQKWGNSCGIRIPSSVLKELELKENDKLDISVYSNKITLSKNYSFNICEQVEEYKKKSNSEYIPHEEWNPDDIVGREVW